MTVESVLLTISQTIGRWIYDQYADDAHQEIKERWEKFRWKEAESRYQNNLRYDHSNIRVLGRSEPIELEGIFTDIYILNQLSSLQRYDITEIRKNQSNHFERGNQYGERQDGLKLVAQGKNLFILGKPGAGKTTFLRYICLKALDGALNKIPIFISLNEWSSRNSVELLSFITEQFGICEFPDAEPFVEHILREGGAIVLFDGLDEVNRDGDKRRLLTLLLNDFAKRYRKSQVLITCRIAASDYQFKGFRDVEIADFTQKQIHTYARKWFGENEAKYKAFIADLYDEKNVGLRELCSRPLLLSMLCLAFDETMRFPERRAELYEDALDALLRKWDSSRGIRRQEIYRGLTRQQKIRLFSRIAANTFENGDYFFDQHWLEECISKYIAQLPEIQDTDSVDGLMVLKAIESQHSIFVERSRHVYAFSHLTFQEYFTARFVVDNEADGAVNRLISSYFDDERWREVLLLAASMMSSADRFFIEFCQRINQSIINEKSISIILDIVDKKVASLHENSWQPVVIRSVYLFFVFTALRAKDRELASIFSLILKLEERRTAELYRAVMSILKAAQTQASNKSLEFIFERSMSVVEGQIADITRFTTDPDILNRAYDPEITQNFIYVFENFFDDLLEYECYSAENIKHFIPYLSLCKFYIECLNIATVSKRLKFKNSILLSAEGIERQIRKQIIGQIRVKYADETQ